MHFLVNILVVFHQIIKRYPFYESELELPLN